MEIGRIEVAFSLLLSPPKTLRVITHSIYANWKNKIARTSELKQKLLNSHDANSDKLRNSKVEKEYLKFSDD